MASEIRANKQTNRVGLGTVTYTDTGIIVSGIVTANSFKGDGSSLTGIDATALKDTSGNVKIQAQASGAVHSGISTFNEIKLDDNLKIKFGDGGDLEIYHNGADNYIDAKTGSLYFRNTLPTNTIFQTGNFTIKNQSNNQNVANFAPGANGGGKIYHENALRFNTTSSGAVVSGILTATSFSGDGSSLSNLPASAPVGGASTNSVFFENDTAVAVNYQITSGKNAMSAGPIAINAGIAVTVPSGSSWTIV